MWEGRPSYEIWEVTASALLVLTDASQAELGELVDPAVLPVTTERYLDVQHLEDSLGPADAMVRATKRTFERWPFRDGIETRFVWMRIR